MLVPGTNCPSQEMTDEYRNLFVRQHNTIRRQIAEGTANGHDGSKIGPAKNMYRLKYNCDLETQALDATRLACVDSIQHPAKYGQNIYTYVTKEIYDLDKKLLITNAVKQWYLPVVHYGLREPNNVYADPRLFTFANLAYDKQVAVGCAYKECPNPSTRGIATCFYNFVVPPNAQLWEHGKACAFDTDCTYSGYPGSTCNNGLCVRPGNTLPAVFHRNEQEVRKKLNKKFNKQSEDNNLRLPRLS
ncbi:SCP-like protein [Ancylostoma ceylanicum]|uniref:SCP-like protein n=1 Tax=Ancylostoma ceylanicum TaxID=53326 RepID=A0A0D6LHU2_9BILA|nr:SCP-like protein [Ancylostoma ceylanicum]